jgi:hypothetical protein
MTVPGFTPTHASDAAFDSIRKAPSVDEFLVRIGGPINGRVARLCSKQDAKRRVYKHFRTLRIKAAIAAAAA